MKPAEPTTCNVCGTDTGGGCPWLASLLMFEALVAEHHAADLEGRPPRSSNVIEFFRQWNEVKMSEEEVAKLFDTVLWAYRRIRGARIDRT
jgi:hypothetical protein